MARTHHTLAGPDQVLVDQFQTEWCAGTRPSISQFAGSSVGSTPQQHKALLAELVAIDLWHRWTQPEPALTGELPPRPLLDEYVRTYPELGPLEQLPATLVREEYRVRRLQGEAIHLAEYRTRFAARGDLVFELEQLERELAGRIGSMASVSLRSAGCMTIRCPHCGGEITAAADAPETMNCSACGGSIRLVGECDVPAPRAEDTPGSGRLEVRCPSCHAPMEVAVDTVLTDLTCSSCGSHFSLVDQNQATRMAPPLSRLGRFELVERIGVGGFGSVWKARDKELDRTVAIKIPRHGGMAADEQEKFFREARAAAQLRHPNIVSVHEVGRDGDSLYIVSDLVRGVTLGDWLTAQQLTGREAAELCAKIADALHHAHEQGVVHRDLKPANIMIDGEGQPHVMDFGLARREVGEVTVTLDGHILGTPAYMSPEQAQGKAHTADRRSDVYSLGVVLFQLLTGELPFRGNARMILHQVIHDEPPGARKLNANVHKDLETVALKCLHKEPARRYATAHELAEELRRFLRGEPIHARPIGRTERAVRWVRRNQTVSVLSATVALALVAGTIISTLFAIDARRQADLAIQRQQEAENARTQEVQAREQAEKVSNFLVRAFRSPDPSRDGRTVTVAEILDRAAERKRRRQETTTLRPHRSLDLPILALMKHS